MRNLEGDYLELYREFETINTIECSNCGATEKKEMMDDLSAAEIFYNEGWRLKKRKIFCSSCCKRNGKKFFKEVHVLLRDLEKGEVFLDEQNRINIYMGCLTDDIHLIKKFENPKAETHTVPHGMFKVFKEIKK